MAVPYMKKAMKGWTKRIKCKRFVQSVVEHKTVDTLIDEPVLDINKQPVPAAIVNKKPEEQRTWVWWSLIVTKGTELNIDDIVEIQQQRFKIQVKKNWSESGFRKYEAIEDYTNG